MQHHYNTGAGSLPGASLAAGGDVEGLILSCSESVKAMAWGFARSSDGRVEVDEMFSIGMLEVCETVAAGRLAGADNPGAYLVGAARFAMINEWRRLYGLPCSSLDAPLSDEPGAANLYDLVAAPALASAPAGPSKREQALHGALRRLSPRQRAVIRRRYGLEGRGSTSRKMTGGELRCTESNVKQLQRRGLDRLQVDARLCSVVGLEVQA